MVCLTLLYTCCVSVGSIKCLVDEENLSFFEGGILYPEHEEENASERDELSIILDQRGSGEFVFIKKNVPMTLSLTDMGKKQW